MCKMGVETKPINYISKIMKTRKTLANRRVSGCPPAKNKREFIGRLNDRAPENRFVFTEFF